MLPLAELFSHDRRIKAVTHAKTNWGIRKIAIPGNPSPLPWTNVLPELVGFALEIKKYANDIYKLNLREYFHNLGHWVMNDQTNI